MKKRNVIIVIVIIILISISCFAYIITDKMSGDDDYNENLENENENIEMKIEEVSDKSIEITLINHDTETFNYTDYFILREYNNGKWKRVDFKRDVGFAKCVRELPVNSSETVTIEWSDYFKQKLPKGTYRIEWVHILDFEL